MIGRALSWLVIQPIRFYQIGISPLMGPCCGFVPSCSEYAIEVVRKDGVVKGTARAIWRYSGAIHSVPAGSTLELANYGGGRTASSVRRVRSHCRSNLIAFCLRDIFGSDLRWIVHFPLAEFVIQNFQQGHEDDNHRPDQNTDRSEYLDPSQHTHQ